MDLVRSAGKRSARLIDNSGDDNAPSEWKESHDPSGLRAATWNSRVFAFLPKGSETEPVQEY